MSASRGRLRKVCNTPKFVLKSHKAHAKNIRWGAAALGMRQTYESFQLDFFPALKYGARGIPSCDTSGLVLTTCFLRLGVPPPARPGEWCSASRRPGDPFRPKASKEERERERQGPASHWRTCRKLFESGKGLQLVVISRSDWLKVATMGCRNSK